MTTTASKLVFGTMRLHEETRSVNQWAEFFLDLHMLGINTLHSSNEYESFPLLCEILRSARDKDPTKTFRHMVKLASPNFDEHCFQPANLPALIRSYCDSLDTLKIEDVQWMWRAHLSDERKRLNLLQKNAVAISKTMEILKAEGMVERVFCFPYSPDFASHALEIDGIDGLAVYRNRFEREYEPAIVRSAELGKSVVVIRPFRAGDVLDISFKSPRAIFDDAINMPAIESAVVSSGKLDHISELVN